MTEKELFFDYSNVYRLLSACFYEPDRELFLEENLCGNLQVLLEKICPEAVMSAEQMGKEIHDGVQIDLALEHAALFVGPFELLAPPYGSVYLEEGNRLMGDTTIAVQKIYAENGLELDVQEPADNISFELEFMHYLYCLEADSVVNDNGENVQDISEVRKDFLEAYLISWIPQFCERIRQGTDNLFYHSLADCLDLFIAREAVSLSLARGCNTKEYVCQTAV